MKLKDGLVIGPGDYKDEFQIKGMQLKNTLEQKYGNSNLKLYGMQNAWNTIVCMDALIHNWKAQAKKDGTPIDTQQLTVFFNDMSMKNQTTWRGLSGSDDLAWAVVYLIKCWKITNDKKFLFSTNKLNGSRGAK